MLDLEEIRSCYFTAHDVVNNFIETELYTKSRTPVEFLTYFNFEIFCATRYDIEFLEYDFKTLGKYIGGNLQIVDDVVLIISDSNNSKARQNFTKMHEIYHYIGHYLMGIKGQSFGQSISNHSLAYEDLILEQEANFGASFMQISDAGLIKSLKAKKRFNQICDDFSMSHAALHNRIMSYLVFEKEINQNQALNLVNGYRYSNRIIPLKTAIYGFSK